MSLPDEDVVVALMYLRYKKQQKEGRTWAHPYYSLHVNRSPFILSRELDQDPAKCFHPKQFDVRHENHQVKVQQNHERQVRSLSKKRQNRKNM